MKKYLLLRSVSAIVFMGCNDQLLLDEALVGSHQLNSNNELNTLIEQARWGDGQAFLKLADCYREGNGVEKDFVGMLCMLAQASEYGGIDCMEDYLKKMPEGSDFKMIFDAINKFEDTLIDEANLMAEQIIANGSPDGYTVQGIMAIENGDTVGGRRLMEQAAAQGSAFAELMLVFPEWNAQKTPNMERLKELSDKMPFANIVLAKFYAKSEREENLAAHYYLKADEKAFLGKQGARWLLSNRQFVDNLSLSVRDIERLQTLAGERVIKEQTPVKTIDEALEATVGQILQEKMAEHSCAKGVVCVVESATGAIKAQVSLVRNGKRFIPAEDAYDEEQSVMMAGPTYLALLSTGLFAPDNVIDTGCGIYKDVRDHNWRRGGYGEITFDNALCYRSQVAFTKAKEIAMEKTEVGIDDKVTKYLAHMPNSPMGMLTFYNAIANDGRMVKLVTKEGDAIVLNEQIEDYDKIKILQKGMSNAVSYGLCRKAGSEYTTVAACCRTFQTKVNKRRMELCGYFPADKPLYTIMVILEKEGLPASAGGMCGPIMSSTIDLLVNSYNLQPSLVREYEEPDEIIEVIDTLVAE